MLGCSFVCYGVLTHGFKQVLEAYNVIGFINASDKHSLNRRSCLGSTASLRGMSLKNGERYNEINVLRGIARVPCRGSTCGRPRNSTILSKRDSWEQCSTNERKGTHSGLGDGGKKEGGQLAIGTSRLG